MEVGAGRPPVLIAGPCVLESEELALGVAAFLSGVASRLSLPVVFKGSFDKANRSSRDSYRGPGEKEAAWAGARPTSPTRAAASRS